MAITLSTDQPTNYVRHNGGEVFDLAAGKTLKIETSPGGEEKLNITVPAGKYYEVHISVLVEEHDV